MFYEEITKIDPTKKFLKFLGKRFESQNYRGNFYSQHNRYDIDYMWDILREIYLQMKKENLKFLQIRTQDISKRPETFEDEKSYSIIVSNLANKYNRTTQDSLRKNLFVELNRMGLLNRYNKEYDLVVPSRNNKKRIKYVNLTKLGKKFIKADKMYEKQIVFQQGLDNLFDGLTYKLINYLTELDNTFTNSNNNYITKDEYTLFLSFVNNEIEFEEKKIFYGFDEIKKYILEFRLWPRYNKKFLINKLVKLSKQNLDNKKNINKNDKRDWRNLVNETDQVFSLLEQTPLYFVDSNKKLSLSFNNQNGKKSFFNKEKDGEKLKRNLKEKKEYFKQHFGKIEKTDGYQLHHIVPLLMAKNSIEYFMLDKWQNMLYIDGKTHAKITVNGSTHTILEFDNDDINLKQHKNSDDEKSKYLLKHNDNVLYNTKFKKEIKRKNQEILDSLL